MHPQHVTLEKLVAELVAGKGQGSFAIQVTKVLAIKAMQKPRDGVCGALGTWLIVVSWPKHLVEN